MKSDLFDQLRKTTNEADEPIKNEDADEGEEMVKVVDCILEALRKLGYVDNKEATANFMKKVTEHILENVFDADESVTVGLDKIKGINERAKVYEYLKSKKEADINEKEKEFMTKHEESFVKEYDDSMSWLAKSKKKYDGLKKKSPNDLSADEKAFVKEYGTTDTWITSKARAYKDLSKKEVKK